MVAVLHRSSRRQPSGENPEGIGGPAPCCRGEPRGEGGSGRLPAQPKSRIFCWRCQKTVRDFLTLPPGQGEGTGEARPVTPIRRPPATEIRPPGTGGAGRRRE